MKISVPIALALVALQAIVDAERQLKKSKKGKTQKATKKGEKKGGNGSSSPSSSSDDNDKRSNISGLYFGQDIEDGTHQSIELFCNEDDLCDITLLDPIFSTCFPSVGGLYGGIATAKNIPIDELDNFKLTLYCLDEDDIEINYEDEPSAVLTGNMVFPPEGGLFRNGPGFYYYKLSDPEISRDDNDAVVGDINGEYSGIDFEDGTGQHLSILCDSDMLCDIILTDFRFSTCAAINSNTGSFFKGVAIAKGVPKDSIDDFTLDLYCLQTDELEVDVDDPSRAPDTTLVGNLGSLKEGVLQRFGPGFMYYKRSLPRSSEGDISQKLLGIDTEDGSLQTLTLECSEGFCNISLIDASFSSCRALTPGGLFLGGLARADHVPRDSLDNFTLDLYCNQNFIEAFSGLNYDRNPTATLDGSLMFLEDGVVRRTGTGFVFFNSFREESTTSKIGNGEYRGTSFFDGVGEYMMPTCSAANGLCQVTFFKDAWTECIRQSGNPPNLGTFPQFGTFGFGVARNIPQESLDNFDMPVYCFGTGREVNIDVEEPTYIISGVGLIASEDPAGKLQRADTPTTVHYKLNSD